MTTKIIRLSKSCIGPEEVSAVSSVLNDEFLGMGPRVKVFEQALSNFFGVGVSCVSSGTAAVQLALQASSVGEGDEVLVPSLTYVATFQAITALGAIPVPCDVDESWLTLCPKSLNKSLTKKTKAVIPVYYSGGIHNIDEIINFSKENNLHYIADAAHAFGSSEKKELIGSGYGVSCFSFDGIKNITSGEGGCIVTQDKKILDRVNDLRLLGVMGDSSRRFSGERQWALEVKEQGWRYHMSDIMAAIGIEQLKKFNKLKEKRQALAKYYASLLINMGDKITFAAHDYDDVVPHIFVVRIKGMQNRENIRDKLKERGIQTGIHYYPNHRLEYFKGFLRFELPVTDKVYDELLTLPLHPDISFEDVKFIVDSLLEFIAG